MPLLSCDKLFDKQEIKEEVKVTDSLKVPLLCMKFGMNKYSLM